jgi:hypothetical protein
MLLATYVSDHTRNLFISGTPVPLTVHIDVLIVAKVANIVRRGVKSQSRLYLYSEEDDWLRCRSRSLNPSSEINS